jgi:hypothetical protein
MTTFAVTSSLPPQDTCCSNSIEAPRSEEILVLNTEEVVHPRGREVVDPKSPHHENDGLTFPQSPDWRSPSGVRTPIFGAQGIANRVRGTRARKNLCLRGLFVPQRVAWRDSTLGQPKNCLRISWRALPQNLRHAKF